MPRGIAAGVRVRYSAEGIRLLCRPGDRFAGDPESVGTFLGMVTQKVGRVLWDHVSMARYLHVDYLEPVATPPRDGQASDAEVPPPVVSDATLSTVSSPPILADDAKTATLGSAGVAFSSVSL